MRLSASWPGGALFYILCYLLVFIAIAMPAAPAFPGAEGCGANAVGGRGGTVYYVTNLYDYTGSSDPNRFGTLRYGISSATGPRTILFKVSGTIELASDLSISKPYLTIAGQTAPGDGITLKRRTTRVNNTHDVIVRFIRCRPGDTDTTFQGDTFWVVDATNVIVDHVSTSWSVDECLSVTWSTNVTVQWCMITESLNRSQHDKGAHGYGSLLRYANGALTFHHNLYAHNNSRNPRLGDNLKLDFVNNVIYNWGGRAGYSGDNSPTGDAKDNPDGFTNYLNYIGNYLIAGPSSTTPSIAFASGATNTVIYPSGNLIDTNKNTLLDGIDTGGGMFNGYPYTAAASPYPLPALALDSAATAYQRVLAFVGHSSVRDEVDLRLIGNVRSHTGRIVDAVGPSDQPTDYVTNNLDGINYVFVRGWPVLHSLAAPADTDDDGIPDYWEDALGWNPNVANNNHTNSDGYTDLEWYLNWLADLHAVGGADPTIRVDLRPLTRDGTNLAYTVANGTNGTVTLAGDGYTAQFVPVSNFKGMASFLFCATNAVDRGGFGPVAVAVLVTNTVLAQTPPRLDPISNAEIIAGATLTFALHAVDTDQPAQKLAYALLDAPFGAAIDATNGLLTWRPTIAQGGTTNSFSVVVADSGTPSLSATQSFTVTVQRPMPPILQHADFKDGPFSLRIDGDAGPDYIVQASPNLIDWTDLVTTNSPALPFLWSDPDAGSFNQRFYRVFLGP
jgi:pectate lyase